MRILVTGAAGQLGREICRQFGSSATGVARDRLDITSKSAVQEIIAELQPDAVVLCAAYTQVDRAEDDPVRCGATNVDSVEYFVDACRNSATRLVLVSTDYLFGGDFTRKTPYREYDPPAPLNVYGTTKAAAERTVSQAARHLIVRTCGLYDAAANSVNIVNTMLRLAASGKPLRVVNDQYCTPSYVPHVARAIRELLSRDLVGTFHVVNSGATTWYEFACEIFRQLRQPTVIEPITSAQYAAKARRPTYSVLDNHKYHATGGWPLPKWREALAECLAVRGLA